MKDLLLLDEDREGRESLARILRKRGFHVAQAADEASALMYLTSTHHVDLVIAGVTYSDRLEFLADLRENRPTLPVIFLTDYCGPESRLRGLLGPFSQSRSLNFFINMRPIGFHELDRLIRIALNGRHAESKPYNLITAAAA